MAPPKLKPIRSRKGVQQLIKTRSSPRLHPATSSEEIERTYSQNISSGSRLCRPAVEKGSKDVKNAATSEAAKSSEIAATVYTTATSETGLSSAQSTKPAASDISESRPLQASAVTPLEEPTDKNSSFKCQAPAETKVLP